MVDPLEAHLYVLSFRVFFHRERSLYRYEAYV